ncbi:MAG: elongation factor Ts [Deltaproteobacteria bacterium]|nr:elongation factor Ts [Deltaproteobacteria bacterium]
MSNVSMDQIKELRQRSGAGISSCKKALEETGGGMSEAIEYLQKKGLAKAKAKGKEAREGIVHAYIHPGGRVGVMVEVNCNTDFVARTEDFTDFSENVAMQIAAMSPLWVDTESVPDDALAKQKEIFGEQAKASGKPEKVIEKIVEGKIRKWYSDVCLLNQPYVQDDKQTIDALRGSLISKTGENIVVSRFVRYELGEKDE